MFCRNCGSQMPGGARFCDHCGAPVGAETTQPSPPPPSAPQPQPGAFPPSAGYSYGPSGPPKRSRRGLWIGLAAVAVVIIAAAVALPLLLLGKDEGPSPITTVVVKPTTTTARTLPPTTLPTGTPGDSAGRWAELPLPATPAGAYSLSLSDEALVVDANSGSDYELFVYSFGSDGYTALPLEGTVPPDSDLDGRLVVWREGTEDPDTYDFVDTSICAYQLPNGPKLVVRVQQRESPLGYPQVAGPWITWTEHEPSDFNPEEYWYQHIYLAAVDEKGAPADQPIELVSSAPADMFGEGSWEYSLSDGYVAWEEAAPHRMFDAGTYVVSLGPPGMPRQIGEEAWLPSVSDNTVVYWENGLMAADLAGERTWQIDPLGDFPTAAPTYAAYFRPVEANGETKFEIVARGYEGAYEQVLATASLDPYFLPRIGASGRHIAFILDDTVRLFEWQSLK